MPNMRKYADPVFTRIYTEREVLEAMTERAARENKSRNDLVNELFREGLERRGVVVGSATPEATSA